ncbi:MAG: chromosomal replication initiator protein DnaA [Deltaproteobacteria bacterium]|nr:chromosomal replication initiator protein DnaA [Deltaproteobacteria bacterium]
MEAQFWSQFEKRLKTRIGATSYNRWLSHLTTQDISSNTATLSCPNTFVLDWIRLHFYGDILATLREVTGQDLSLRLVVAPSREEKSRKDTLPKRQLSLPGTENYLHGLPFINREYTFTNFVVGPCNQFAYASAQAVTERKSRLYNPVFFHSSEGLGKTHLSTATGQKIITNYPETKVFYTTAEWFTHEMIQALRKNLISEFKEKYRKRCDVLVIEDIQFLQGKDKTQDEVFYTLDTLIQMDKQVILTANADPREINDLKANLRSRMGSGLVVDIKKPDYETKRNIIARKCAKEQITISEEVADYIARTIESNVRDLTSALINLIATSSLLGQKIDLDLAKETLKSFIKNKTVTVAEIKKFISHHFKITLDQLQSKSRSRGVTYPRQVAYYFCRKYTDITLSAIGENFGRNHSSVLRALNKFETSMRTNRNVRDAINYLTDKFEKSYL